MSIKLETLLWIIFFVAFLFPGGWALSGFIGLRIRALQEQSIKNNK